MVSALVLVGAPGSGKSSVLGALTTLLEIEGTAYGAIETEQLSWGSPLLPAEDWLPQLAAIMALQRGAGRTLFLLAATTETAGELRALVDAVAADNVIVVCLTAPPEVVAARIAEREPDQWPGKQRLIAHAGRLAQTIPLFADIDILVDTEGRDPREVAHEIRGAVSKRLAPMR